MKYFCGAILAILALAATAQAGLPECMEAVCRIRNGNSWGTGCVIARSSNGAWILTNAHVAGRQQGEIFTAPNQVAVEFWRGGYKSQAITASTYAVYFTAGKHRDIALVFVPAAALGDYIPPAIPIAGPEEEADYRQLRSVGCPNAVWPNSWEGHATRRDQSAGDTIQFVPMPAPGRSGSPIFNREGTKVIALVAWRAQKGSQDGTSESDGYGVAMTHKEIWAAFSGSAATGSAFRPTSHRTIQEIRTPLQAPGHCYHGVPFAQHCDRCPQCGPNGCPSQQCGPNGCFPFLGRPQQPQQPPPAPIAPQAPQGNPFPTLPADLAPQTGSLSIDTADTSRFVTRSEFDSAAAEFRSKLSALADTPDKAASLSRKLEEVTAAVTTQERTLKDKLRDVIQSDEFRDQLAALKNDVLNRLKESAATDADWKTRLHDAVTGAVEARVAEVKAKVEAKLADVANKPAPDGGGGLLGILGVAAAVGLPLAGIGGWQAWVVQAGIARLAKRASTPPENRTTILDDVRGVIRNEFMSLIQRPPATPPAA